MAEAGVWVVWGIPTRGRETQALEFLKDKLTGYLQDLVREGRIERFDAAVLKPQSNELGGFVLIQGTRQQIESLHQDKQFESYAFQVQAIADNVGIVEAWVGDGLQYAFGLYEDALRDAGLMP
ncbi:hypothetical protein H7J93_26615 [Mycobacterium barrassiae]|uniref:hypothetical protein n=1 Tax=Mycobacterium barrassiae TaxID=319709 RepID=UPI002265C94B|nr:hypothetical protein [Mycobacterium barrassiae]MCV7303203.1 hypothetical protein [Mycobacterium barrassiae]